MPGPKAKNGKCLNCPAGQLMQGGGAVLCRVEGVLLDPDGDKVSIENFCTSEGTENNHYRCPSWRQHKNTGMTQAQHARVTRHREYLAELADEELLGEFEERAGRA